MKTTNNSDTNEVLKSGTFTGSVKFFQLAIRYVYSVLATRLFGAENFGIFVLTRTVAEFGSIFSGLGLQQGLLRHIPHYRSTSKEDTVKKIVSFSFIVSLFISIIFSLLVFSFSDYIAINFFHKIVLSKTLKIISIIIPVLTLIKLIYAYLRGYKQIKKRVMLENIILPVLLVINSFIFYYFYKNFYGLILGFLAANCETLIIGIFFSKAYSGVLIKGKIESKLRKEVILYSWPLLLASSIDYLQKYADTLMMGIFSTSSAVGVYTVALRVSAFIAIPLGSFNMLFSPLVAEIFAVNDIPRLDKLYKNVTKVTLTFSLLIFGIILLLPKELLHIFGKEFIFAVSPLLIISTGQLINVSVGGTGQILIMTGNQRINLLNSIVFLFFTVVLNYLLIPKYGVLGAGIANFLTLSGLNIVRVIQIKKLIGILPFSISVVKPLLGATIGFVIVNLYYNLFNENLFIKLSGAFIFVAVFLSLLFLFGIDEFEKEFISKISRKIFRHEI